MDEELIARWNVVGDDDVVYHLGDFTLGEDAAKYIQRLKGRIAFLGMWWHHDRRWITSKCEEVSLLGHSLVKSIRSASGHPIKVISPLSIVTPRPSVAPPIMLCHYPFAVWDRKHYGAWHLHGHSHGRYQGEGFIHDVGVDNNDFYPVSLERVKEIMVEKGWHEGWRQYG